MSAGMILGIGALVLAVAFVLTWILSIRKDNYSFVDVTWAFSFTPVALVYGLFGSGWEPRRMAIAVLVCFWSLRLGVYLFGRVASHHPEEDVRYAVLRQNWSANLKGRFFFFFMVQAVLVWVLMLPVFLIASYEATGFHVLEYCGFALWGVALIGEGIADAQLKRFKARGATGEAVCREGLWRYSRHPNYFFQSLLWWGLFLMALPSPYGWCALMAPLLMLHFLLRVTGIPLTERLAVERKGDAYRQYQRETNAFFPWIPKTKISETS